MNEAEHIILNLAIELADLRARLDQAISENKVLRAMAAETQEHTHEEDQEAH